MRKIVFSLAALFMMSTQCLHAQSKAGQIAQIIGTIAGTLNQSLSSSSQSFSSNNAQAQLKPVDVFIIKHYVNTDQVNYESRRMYAGVYGNNLSLFRNNIYSSPVICGAKRNGYATFKGFNVRNFSHMVFGSHTVGVIHYYFFNY